jgi:hypothetical protein
MYLARRHRAVPCVSAEIGAKIRHRQSGAARRQQARGGEPAYAEPDHHHAFARKVHLNKFVNKSVSEFVNKFALEQLASRGCADAYSSTPFLSAT